MRQYTQQQREHTRKRALEYHNQRKTDPIYLEKKKVHAKKAYEKRKHLLAGYWNKYKHKNRDIWKARYTIYNYLKAGKITKPKVCSDCKKEGRIQAHHHDYSKPLEVIWVCSLCHGIRHTNNPLKFF